MKKKILLLMGVFAFGLLQAQIGVNTENPQALFHIDGVRDNNLTGAPTATQIENDVVITSAGNLGLGTLTPQAKLEIHANIQRAGIFVNGMSNKTLLSDASGNGTWGNYTPTTNLTTIFRNVKSTGWMIGWQNIDENDQVLTLTRGYWLITAKFMTSCSSCEEGIVRDSNGNAIAITETKAQFDIRRKFHTWLALAENGAVDGNNIVNYGIRPEVEGGLLSTPILSAIVRVNDASKDFVVKAFNSNRCSVYTQGFGSDGGFIQAVRILDI